jgi:hypothetical protein
MNYYKLQTTYFLIFILIASLALAVIPAVSNTMNNYSDSYVKSQMNKIQGEMMFISIKRNEYYLLCTSGQTGLIINDLVKEYGKYVSCRTNKPKNTEAMMCASLKSGSYYCVDSGGVSCEVFTEPTDVYKCKNLA